MRRILHSIGRKAHVMAHYAWTIVGAVVLDVYNSDYERISR